MSKQKIGFIGLGLMGAALCQRLLDLDYPLTVIANRSREGVDAAVERGAREVTTSREVAECSDVVLLCMDTSASVEGRMLGDDGVIAGLSEGNIVVDFGTSLPGSTRALGEKVAAVGAHFLDAPMARTPTHAREGKVNFMCSGEKAGFDTVQPVLQDMAESVFYLGELGTGHTIKLINNFYSMTIANAMAEAFAMADKLNVDRQQLYDVMAAGPLHSGMMDFIKAYAVDGNPGALAFAVKNAAKDVGYYSKMVGEVGVESIMCQSALKALETARDNGFAEKMVSQMPDFFSETYS